MTSPDSVVSDERLWAAFRNAARDLDGIDRSVYETFGKDPLEPIIGLGAADTPIALFGRDPGREEVRHGVPFIGTGGQKLRAALYRYRHSREMPDFAASIAVGRACFWANTVPYKPLGNKAWPMPVKRRFHPLMARVLLNHWRGRKIITLGREAFFWFGIGQPRDQRRMLEAFWKREDRFGANIEVMLADDAGESRSLRLYPLPHPSPLNATWYKRFPELFSRRLRQLSVPTAAPQSEARGCLDDSRRHDLD